MAMGFPREVHATKPSPTTTPASTSALVSGTELRMGEGIKKGSQMGKYTLLGNDHISPHEGIFLKMRVLFLFGGIYWFPGG